MWKQFYFEQFSLVQVRSLNVKTVLVQPIQFSICIQFSSIWPIDTTVWWEAVGLFYSTIQLGLRILYWGVLFLCREAVQSTRPEDTRWGMSYNSAEKQSVYSTAPFICRCLPPDTTWHKVKSLKAD